MLESVRARLALWHTATLAALLLVFASASYVFLQQTMQAQTDEYLAATAGAFSGELVAERSEEDSDSLAVAQAVQEFRLRDGRITVFDSSLRQLATIVTAEPGHGRGSRWRGAGRNDGWARRAASSSLLARLLYVHRSAEPVLFTVPGRAGGDRVYATPLRVGSASYMIVATQSLRDQQETLEKVQRAYLVAIPLALILAGLGGYVLARRGLAPVVTMSAHAARIGAANLHERLPVINPRDELGQLATVFNDLLSRLSGAFEQQRTFMADASHELRTPVAIMRGEADIALSRDERSAAEYREALAVIGDEGRRLSSVVNDLFLLARADAGQAPLRRGELYLDELAAECVRAVRSLAMQRRIGVSYVAPGECPYRGDEELLRRAMLNVLDNAIKYSAPGATVSVELMHYTTNYRITIRDTGPGIPAEAQQHLFERFYRADRARARLVSSDTGGAGLGLAIGRVVAEAHGGRLDLVRSNECGSEFALTLPLPVV
jgi:heavy metal sensor kinase